MLKHGMITERDLYTVYAPFTWLVEHVPFFSKALEAYIWLWVGDWTPSQ